MQPCVFRMSISRNRWSRPIPDNPQYRNSVKTCPSVKASAGFVAIPILHGDGKPPDLTQGRRREAIQDSARYIMPDKRKRAPMARYGPFRPKSTYPPWCARQGWRYRPPWNASARPWRLESASLVNVVVFHPRHTSASLVNGFRYRPLSAATVRASLVHPWRHGPRLRIPWSDHSRIPALARIPGATVWPASLEAWPALLRPSAVTSWCALSRVPGAADCARSRLQARSWCDRFGRARLSAALASRSIGRDGTAENSNRVRFIGRNFPSGAMEPHTPIPRPLCRTSVCVASDATFDRRARPDQPLGGRNGAAPAGRGWCGF